MHLTLRTLWRLLHEPAILSICLVVFLADVMSGFVVPTIPLYATGLGASVALVGALSAVVSLISIFTALPIGLWSDRQGRKRVIASGMLLFALSSALYALAPNAYWLFPLRMLAGMAAVAVFSISAAYVGDVVRPGERGLIIGVYTTAMGFGFAVGPMVSGLLVARYGYRISYLVAAGVALVGWWVAWRFLQSSSRPAPVEARADQSVGVWHNVRLLFQNPPLLAACLGNFCNNLLFSTTFSFLPLYAAALGMNTVAIGSLFATRALASTAARIPTGILSTMLKSRYLMLAALAVAVLVMTLVALSQTPAMLAGVMLLEGLTYGVFLTAAQAFLTESAHEETRGAAVGLYGTAGSMGGTVGPLLLGLLAEMQGLAAVFVATALLLTLGWLALGYLTLRQREPGQLPAASP